MPVETVVVDALNAQMGREFEAHLQYLEVSSWFDAEGLPELTRFFANQAAEEHEHAMKFLTFIQDVGGAVAIPSLNAPKATFESAEEAVGRDRAGRGGQDHVRAAPGRAPGRRHQPAAGRGVRCPLLPGTGRGRLATPRAL